MAGRKKHRSATPRLYDKPYRKPVLFDVEYATELLEESLKHNLGLSREKPKGVCYDCDKPVTGERKLCGLCTAKRESNRE